MSVDSVLSCMPQFGETRRGKKRKDRDERTQLSEGFQEYLKLFQDKIVPSNDLEHARIISDNIGWFRARLDGLSCLSDGLCPIEFFFTAIEKGHLETVKIFVENIFDRYIDIQNEYGETPLMRAAEHSQETIIEYLLQMGYGATIHFVDNNKRSALILAAWGGHKEIVEWLGEYLMKAVNYEGEGYLPGMDTQDEYGKTALMMAASYGHTEIVEYLVANGADMNISDGNGDTALMLAAKRGHKRIVKYLLSRGANKISFRASKIDAIALLLKNSDIKKLCGLGKFSHNRDCNKRDALVILPLFDSNGFFSSCKMAEYVKDLMVSYNGSSLFF